MALGKFAWNVFWGALTGSLIMIANYFFMAVTVTLAADQAKDGNAKKAQTAVQLSGTIRLVAMGGLLVVTIEGDENGINSILLDGGAEVLKKYDL